jgi:hypothetical protein
VLLTLRMWLYFTGLAKQECFSVTHCLWGRNTAHWEYRLIFRQKACMSKWSIGRNAWMSWNWTRFP